MDILGINKTVNQALPELDKLADKTASAVAGLESTVTQVTDNGLKALADAVTQIMGAAYRLDGATIQIEGLSVTIVNPKITLNLGPYKPE